MKLLLTLFIVLSIGVAALGVLQKTAYDKFSTVSSFSSYKKVCCEHDKESVLINAEETVNMYFCPLDRKKFCNTVSCATIFEINSNAESGYYNITPNSGDTAEVYCDMKGMNCDNEGGWTRIAYLDMTQPGAAATCPTGLITRNYINLDHQLCSKADNDSGCTSVYYTTLVNYTKVCGQFRGYQYGSPDGMSPRLGASSSVLIYVTEIEDMYVDGVSISYGNTTRKHLWTYAAGVDEDQFFGFSCPCTEPDKLFAPPSFIGSNYYCESGRKSPDDTGPLYADDPLWDGNMCGGQESQCCTSPTMPWFIRSLNEETSEPVEVRLCRDESFDNEDVPIDIIELYVK